LKHGQEGNMTNTFIVKQPLAIDVSYYEPIWYERADYDKVDPKPKHVIARATYGVRKDTEFINHWNYWRSKSVPVAAYHYWYGTPMYSGQTAADGVGDQADNFIAQVRLAGYTGKERFWLDIEEAGNKTVPNGKTFRVLVKQWLDHVERELGQRPGIYSRKDQLERMAINGVMPEWINDYDQWWAWYPFGPYIDKNPWYPTTTKYRPSWLKKELVMWQYCEDGFIDGFIMKDNHQSTTYDFNACLDGYLESLGANMKGTVIIEPTNVKPMDGQGIVETMYNGDYAFGTVGTTDLMGFDHFYRKRGALVNLGKPYKAHIGNMSLSNVSETPPVEPPPVEPPPVPPATTHIVEVFIDGVSAFRKEL